MKKAVIFLSFTASQNQSIQNCIDYFKQSNRENVDLFLISNAGHIPNGITNTHQLNLTKVTRWQIGLQQILFKHNSKKLILFVESLPDYDEIEICIPHFLNILCNYFYHHCIPKLKAKLIHISLYPDGMLSYQPFEIQSWFQKDSISRWVGGWLSGMRYTVFIGPIADPFSCVKKIYSYIPECTIPYQSTKIIKIEFPNRKINGENILILGHFKQSKFDSDYLIFINKMIQLFLEKENYRAIFYKPHPRISKMSDDVFYQSILKISNIKIELCIDDTPVESLLESIGASSIIAAVSTSMINLKLKYKNQISCYYFGLSYYVLPKYVSYYENVFSHLSIIPLRQYNE
ncbi:alpha-2,8-polysialyltransferase family protein [Candidatus Marinimicrobia bacterium]|nr:alpha-2,8-polysialyltransferase family protein [Candidatus Neomarinimicrobiota bacterium]MDC1038561.1 hypothetical protein [Candidatus Neomarinimicrobiota bacterium]